LELQHLHKQLFQTLEIPTGTQLNIAIGNISPIPNQLIVPTGQQFNVATNPVSVITWNPIPPGVNQVWVPVDPDA